MAKIHITQAAVIDAPPKDVYAVLVDYRVAHPAILPKPYFKELTLEAGGHGAGTVFRLEMEVFGTKANYHMVVSEPAPGRLLVESDIETGAVSSFTVEPLDDGQRTLVTIASEFVKSPGLHGVLEQLVNPPITRRIYREELQLLAAYLQEGVRAIAE